MALILVSIPATEFSSRVKSHHFSGMSHLPRRIPRLGIPSPVFFLQAPLVFENALTHHYPAALWGENVLFIQSAEDFYTNLRASQPFWPTRICGELSVGENNDLEMGAWALWLYFHRPGFLIPGELCPNSVSSILPSSPLTDFLLTSLRGLLEIFRGHFSPGFSKGEAGHS